MHTTYFISSIHNWQYIHYEHNCIYCTQFRVTYAKHHNKKWHYEYIANKIGKTFNYKIVWNNVNEIEDYKAKPRNIHNITNWTGSIGRLERGELDLAFTELSATYHRFQVCRFTPAF